MSEISEKRHTCPLCNGEGVLPEGKVPVDIMPERTRRMAVAAAIYDKIADLAGDAADVLRRKDK